MIYLLLKGGLGNQLFQLAYADYLSKIHNLKIIIDDKYLKYNKYFNTLRHFSLDVLEDKKFKKISYFKSFSFFILIYLLKKIRVNKLKLFNKNIYLIDDTYNDYIVKKPSIILLNGYFQNVINQKIIINDFIINNKIIATNFEKYFNFPNKVCVHIRRGDYLLYSDTFKIQDLDYYNNSINFIRNKINLPIFLFFSDDKEYVLNNFKINNINSFFVSTDNDLDDFALMSNCKHFIISNSTYSLWAAFFGSSDNSIIIYPKQWFIHENVNLDFKNAVIPSKWVSF